MKKIVIVVVLGLLVFQKWDVIDAYLHPAPDYASLHDGKAILYATDWCGYCAKTRKLLNDHDVDYFEYDIEKSSEGLEQYKSLNAKGVPVVLINGTVIRGYSPDKILALIR